MSSGVFINMKRRLCFLVIFSLFVSGIFANSVISDFTKDRVEHFVTYRVRLKSDDFTVAIEKITALRNKTISQLPKYAIDFEQEKCILETMYFMEIYERELDSRGNQKELRQTMKSLVQKNVKCIDSRKKNQISEWLYLVTGDSTSYYMTRSVAATLLYGFKVKDYYENALKINEKHVSAHVSLGNWCFYAPEIFGGGKKKSLSHYEKAIKYASIPGEKYLAYIAFSQLNFENGKTALAEEFLQNAVELGLGQKELDVISKCNKKGYSNFQYLRNRSGIDAEMSEEEKDEADK